MIVSNVESGWEIVFQPAHGLLAGKIAEHFDESLRSEFWFETKAAITAHDDQKIQLQTDRRVYVTELGAPRDFTLVSMSDQQRFEEVRDRLRNAYRKHRWIGLLESMHADFLYSDQDVCSELAELLDSGQSKRKTVSRQLATTKAKLKHAYDIMKWCDRCSLILCQGKVPAMERRLEINSLHKDRYEIWQREDKSLCIAPWPFSTDSFEVGVEVFELQQLSFENDRELGDALDACKPQYRKWAFRQSD